MRESITLAMVRARVLVICACACSALGYAVIRSGVRARNPVTA